MARRDGTENGAQGELHNYYGEVMEQGSLRTREHARTWSRAVLRTLGFYLDRGTKRKLAKALPQPLARDLTSGFWLLHFRDPNMTSREFLRRVALRGGNTDAQYARAPTTAVFRQVKQLITEELSDRIADTLSPEVSDIWREA
jgi:uncharacterized protein (DUF2267 family)